MFYLTTSILLFSIKICTCAKIGKTDGVVVETNVGSIRGLRADDGNYTMFMGIPYASVNELNVFGDSIPYPPFEETFEAFDDTAICPQIEEFDHTIVGTLDCLHLNIYVPDSASTQNQLAVMVYIYGGGFSIGFAGRFLYGPKYIVRHDVILVTINYRLGPYGFMCLGTPEVPGNAGLKDQVTALRWIQNNIEFFGGDLNRITVFGNSAGGMSGALHLISENEKLFKNVIMQSGSALHPGIISDENPNSILALANAFNLETDDLNEAISYLSTINPHDVINASREIGFGICLEKQHPGVEKFLAEHPLNSNYSKVSDTSIMLGYNDAELLALFPLNASPDLWQIWEGQFSGAFSNFNFDDLTRSELQNIARRFYVGDEDINNEVRQRVLDFTSDVSFVYSTIRSIEIYLEAGAEKVYQYLFAYDGNRNFVKIKDNITAPGVAHADEIGYLFKMDFIPDEPTAEDQLIIDRMTTMWTNFAKYGNPTPETTAVLPVNWEAITKGSPYHYLEINSVMKASSRFAHKRMSFWDLFYKAYGKYEYGYNNLDGEDPVPDSSTFAVLNPHLFFLLIIMNFYLI